MRIKKISALLLALVMVMSFAACGSKSGTAVEETEIPFVDEVAIEKVSIEKETEALLASNAILVAEVTEPAGTKVKNCDKAIIDYSSIEKGYVDVKFVKDTGKKIKVQLKGPKTTYTYNINKFGQWETFPFTDGNGSYTVTVFENTSGKSYATVLSQSMTVTLANEFAPYLHTNQYVDYASAPNTVAKGAELCNGKTAVLDKVTAVYQFVVKNFSYDTDLAANVKSGYLPVLDTVLSKKKGICFDYASTMTGMLRSQGVPCKLVVGYAGTAYHAWISVYSEETGWVEGVIQFNGKEWKRMDPTFASSAKSSDKIMKYIGDGSNYTAKYFY